MKGRNRLLMVATLFAVFVVVAAYPATAWKSGGHKGIGRETAEVGDVSSNYVDQMAQGSYWADTTAAEDDSGAWGYSEEKNPWYDPSDLWDSNAGANADHWFNVYNYNNGLWPVGVAHKNAAEFIQNGKNYVDWGYTDYGMKLISRGGHYIQDMSQPHHTVLWDNIEVTEHFNYESWVDNNWESKNLDDWTRYGAYYSYDYDISSKSDIKQAAIDVAQTSNDRKQYTIDGDGTYKENVWATQYNLWAAGQKLGAAYDYAAPGYFDY